MVVLVSHSKAYKGVMWNEGEDMYMNLVCLLMPEIPLVREAMADLAVPI